MSPQKPSLLRVLSDSWRIIRSNSLHFLALSSLFIFPNIVFNITHILTSPAFNPAANYAKLFSPHSSEVPSNGNPKFISLFLYSLPLFLLNICFVISTTNSIFHGFHNKPLKLSSSLKSIVSSFFPLLATKIAYLVIMVVILFGIGLLTGFFFFGLALLGHAIEPNSTLLMVVVFVMVAVTSLVGFAFLEVELILMYPSAVMESEWGFSAMRRSSSLVKGGKAVAWRIIILFWVFNSMLSALLFILPSISGAVVGMVVVGAVSSLLSVLSVASHTVLFVYCKAFNGEAELPTTDQKVQVYIQLPRNDH